MTNKTTNTMEQSYQNESFNKQKIKLVSPNIYQTSRF